MQVSDVWQIWPKSPEVPISIRFSNFINFRPGRFRRYKCFSTRSKRWTRSCSSIIIQGGTSDLNHLVLLQHIQKLLIKNSRCSSLEGSEFPDIPKRFPYFQRFLVQKFQGFDSTMMKRRNRVALPGLENPGLELEMTDCTGKTQVSQNQDQIQIHQD